MWRTGSLSPQRIAVNFCVRSMNNRGEREKENLKGNASNIMPFRDHDSLIAEGF